jgi:hypothetical protein
MKNQAYSSDMRRYALSGAQARLAEITQELDLIRRAFPELGEDQTGRTGSDGAAGAQNDGSGGLPQGAAAAAPCPPPSAKPSASG